MFGIDLAIQLVATIDGILFTDDMLVVGICRYLCLFLQVLLCFVIIDTFHQSPTTSTRLKDSIDAFGKTRLDVSQSGEARGTRKQGCSKLTTTLSDFLSALSQSSVVDTKHGAKQIAIDVTNIRLHFRVCDYCHIGLIAKCSLIPFTTNALKRFTVASFKGSANSHFRIGMQE